MRGFSLSACLAMDCVSSDLLFFFLLNDRRVLWFPHCIVVRVLYRFAYSLIRIHINTRND